MKRSLSAILIFTMILFLAACPVGCGIFDDTVRSQIDDPEGLLPDWELARSGAWNHYNSVTGEMLDAYVDACREKGFSVIGSDESGETTMIRDDVWIVIEKTLESDAEADPPIYNCTELTLIRRPKAAKSGISDGRAMELIGLCLEEDETPVAVIERSTAGAAEDVGLKLFACVVTKNGGPEHCIASFLAGENGALPVEDNYGHGLLGLLAADVDGDGSDELLTRSYGPTSGVYTEVISAVGVSDGVPYIKASNIFTMEYGEISFEKTAEGAALKLAVNVWDPKKKEIVTAGPQLYPVMLDGINLTVDCPPNDENGPRDWGGSAFDYSYYDMREDIKLSNGLTVIARPMGGGYSFALLPTDSADMPIFKYNLLAPVGAEAIKGLLEGYALPAGDIFVVLADIPARDASSVRPASEAERGEIMALIGY